MPDPDENSGCSIRFVLTDVQKEKVKHIGNATHLREACAKHKWHFLSFYEFWQANKQQQIVQIKKGNTIKRNHTKTLWEAQAATIEKTLREFLAPLKLPRFDVAPVYWNKDRPPSEWWIYFTFNGDKKALQQIKINFLLNDSLYFGCHISEQQVWSALEDINQRCNISKVIYYIAQEHS